MKTLVSRPEVFGGEIVSSMHPQTWPSAVVSAVLLSPAGERSTAGRTLFGTRTVEAGLRVPLARTPASCCAVVAGVRPYVTDHFLPQNT